MSTPRWLHDLFSSFTNGELQGGKSIAYPVRTHLSHPRPDQYPYQHSIGTFKVPGTRIPASTLNKFRQYITSDHREGWTPGPRSLKKLIALRDRYNYHRLRASGASTKEAQRHKRSRQLNEVISTYRKTAQTISAQKGIDIAAILWSNRRSERDPYGWDKYIRAKYQSYTDPDEEFDDDDEWDDYLDSESGLSDEEVDEGEVE